MTEADMTDELLDEILDDAALPEVTVPICMRSSLQQDFEAADARLAAAIEAAQTDDSLGAGAGSLEDLAAEVEDIRQRMLARTIVFRFQAREKTRWSQIIAEHPPREENDRDAPLGLNVDGFFTALIRESTVSPKMTPERWTKFLRNLTDGQWDLLTTTLWQLNRERGPSIPFSRAASRILRNSAAALRRPNGSDSL